MARFELQQNHWKLITRQSLDEFVNLKERLNTISRKVAGKNKDFSGDIRITLPESIAKELLMGDFAEFSELHKNIELEIMESNRQFNLSNREADVAIRNRA